MLLRQEFFSKVIKINKSIIRTSEIFLSEMNETKDDTSIDFICRLAPI